MSYSIQIKDVWTIKPFMGDLVPKECRHVQSCSRDTQGSDYATAVALGHDNEPWADS